jgi:hypothetical protein
LKELTFVHTDPEFERRGIPRAQDPSDHVLHCRRE